MNSLPAVAAAQLPVSADTAARARSIIEEGTAANTRRAYAGDLAYFWAWADAALGIPAAFPVPVAAVVQFITDHLHGLREDVDQALVASGVKAKPGPHSLATVERRVAALSVAHQLQKAANPCKEKAVRLLLSKARKAVGKNGNGPRKKKAATRDVLERLLAVCDGSLAGLRDRALLLVGFASGGRRRSELAGFRVEDLAAVPGGYVLHLRHSKTDQAGVGRELPVLGRAAEALDAWTAAAGITSGPLFRGVDRHGHLLGGISDKLVARVVKARAAQAGLDAGLFGGHSLRSGFITEGGRQGKALGDVMALSGHRTASVALGYYQAGAVILNSAAQLVG